MANGRLIGELDIHGWLTVGGYPKLKNMWTSTNQQFVSTIGKIINVSNHQPVNGWLIMVNGHWLVNGVGKHQSMINGCLESSWLIMVYSSLVMMRRPAPMVHGEFQWL